MCQSDVLDVLGLLAMHHVPVWLAGGWGMDALIGRVTRSHADLDLACRAEHETTIIDALSQRGYRIAHDEGPARLVLADDHGREVDLHPVRFDQRGFGIQQGLRPGERFLYPSDAFATGVVGGRPVACLSVEQQLRFHRGYALRDRDRQDLANLRAAAGGS